MVSKRKQPPGPTDPIAAVVVAEVVADARRRRRRGRKAGGALVQAMREGAPKPAATEAAASATASRTPEDELDGADDMLATAVICLKGADRQKVDFLQMVAEGGWAEGTIKAAVGLDGTTNVELYKGNMFCGRETARRMPQLEAMIARLRERWTFMDPL